MILKYSYNIMIISFLMAPSQWRGEVHMALKGFLLATAKLPSIWVLL
jgi:hypothetical protein